ncbi:hypothetical protein RND81_12G078800 [Saponaria officinalis]|uniref:MTHFR SAM-binding regulatory domain-containing protein n=1 Tax=Saponaria officinalis TaxID=3572 RepID=A0AAW1H7V6_SAPOF
MHHVYSNQQGWRLDLKCRPNTVMWGVFPAKEIIQPTVVDPVSFKFGPHLGLLSILRAIHQRTCLKRFVLDCFSPPLTLPNLLLSPPARKRTNLPYTTPPVP